MAATCSSSSCWAFRPRADSVSQVSRAQAIRPTFLMVWLGNNDVLDMATQTNPNAATVDSTQFGNRFRRLLDALADTGAGMAVANLPDVTGIAALRHAGERGDGVQADRRHPARRRGRRPALDRPPPLGAARSALHEVLGPTSGRSIRATIISFNAEIAAAVADTEQQRGVTIAQVDMFTLFDGLHQQGVDIDGNGTPDADGGVPRRRLQPRRHPSHPHGNALIANAFIDAIDQRFGETVPQVDVARVAARDPLVNNHFRPAGEPPFGLIGDDDTNDLAGFFSNVADRVSTGAQDVAAARRDRGRILFGRIKRFFKNVF